MEPAVNSHQSWIGYFSFIFQCLNKSMCVVTHNERIVDTILSTRQSIGRVGLNDKNITAL